MHLELAAKITIGEVIVLNPKKYKTIQVVLENLRDQACLGANREWA